MRSFHAFMTKRSREWVLYSLFFASGASALLFETLWFRLAGLAFGNSVWASSMVLASFMAGLALGNAIVATKLSGTAEPLRLYAVLEAAIGLSGLALVFLFPSFTTIFAPIVRPFIDDPLILNALRLTLCGALMLVPTTAMGATLPLVVSAMSRNDERFGSRLGLLYGWNTAGAVAGALAGEMVLIEAFGLRGTGIVAALLNAGAAAGAALIARRTKPSATVAEVAAHREGASPGPLLAAAFLAGGTLLALEVVWFRFLLLFTDGTSLAFALMLAAVLIGIAAGGLAASRLFQFDVEGQRWTSAVALGCGVATVVCFAGFIPGEAPNRIAAAIAIRDATASLRLMLLTSIGSGLLFTLIGRSLQKRLGDERRSAALLTLANTVGAMIGALAGGLILLPWLGMERSIFVLACCYGVIAILTATKPGRSAWPVTAAVSIAFIASLLLYPFGLIARTFVPLITERYRAGHERILEVREGLTETNIYLRRDLLGLPYSYRLMTNGISMSATTLSARRYMSLFVDLPMALNPGASSALLISYGVGSTAKALTETPSLQSIDVVDISRDVVEMSRLRHFDGGHPLDDPRVRVHIEDGRFFLLTARQRFDLITAEPPPPKNAGIVNLYSREYFELIHDRLTEGGLATYWLPIYQLRASEGKAIIKAFCSAFPDCSLWSGAGAEMILLGTRGVRAVTLEGFERRWRNPVTGRSLAAIGVEAPELLGTLFIADAPWLRRFTAEARPLVDDAPLRLSPRPVADLADEFEPLFDVRASQKRFATSAWIAAVWPPELRAKTLDSFAFRDFADRYFLTGDTIVSQVAYVLARSPYRSLPAILLGSDSFQQNIAAVLRSRGISNPDLDWIDGIRALSERRYDQAVTLLAAASGSRPQNRKWSRDAAFAKELRDKL